MKVISNIVSRLGKVIILFLSMLLTMVVSRLYGVEFVGQYTYLMTILTILVLLISFGTNQSMLANFSKETIQTLVDTNIKLYLLTFICTVLGLFLLYNFEIIFDDKNIKFLVVILIISFIQAISNIFKNKCVVEDKIYLYYYYDILQYSLLILGVVIFYFLSYDDLLYILLSIYIFFSVIILFLNKSLINFAGIIRANTKKEYFTSSFLVFVSTLFLTLSHKYNVFIYESKYSEEILGLYVIAMFLIDGIVLFLASLMFADINKFKEANTSFILKYSARYLFVSVLMIVFIDLFGYKLLQVIYHVSDPRLEIILSIIKYSVVVVLILKIIQNYFIMNKLYKYYLFNSIVFIFTLMMANYLNRGTFEYVLYNYLSALLVTTMLAVFLYSTIDKRM